ncbi:NAD-dependent epimerase/dehydratase family protein [Roseococcus sp. DSY-14]|uniref:NAD-dependent epimerase/dehydratase family protein n=1 Tax=Roseococcus sp. DSY-14 TaxID=3369650 RepID=UPI00387A90AA
MAGPRFLLTGANGFLGTHLLAALRARGLEAWALSRRRPDGLAPDRWLPLDTAEDAPALRAALAAAAPDAILHAAGAATGGPAALYAANAVFAAHLLAAAAEAAPAARLVLAGSAAECGPLPEAEMPLREDAAPRPRDAYGISKLAQTHHALAALERGQRVVVARLFNFIGPGMPAHLALGAFGRQLAAMPPTGGTLRTGDLSGERDILPVEAVAGAMLDLALHPAAQGVVNVCSGQATAMRAVVEELLRRCPFPVALEEEAGRHGVTAVRRHWGDPSRLHALGIRPPPPDLPFVLGRFVAALGLAAR